MEVLDVGDESLGSDVVVMDSNTIELSGEVRSGKTEPQRELTVQPLQAAKKFFIQVFPEGAEVVAGEIRL